MRGRVPYDRPPERGLGLFLKSLTLKGFKSFADKTTLEFEPGVCVVVGPNGSGKSNIVDSVAWVLGAQGARALRGAKMDDVIFAGTADRPALGRAEVSLTIDNTTHLLPIEFSEVTITRTLFRTGESEYMINGVPCRLLDIQELLSDTGIGRQQHVIVGQGQLDAVLNARARGPPGDHRGGRGHPQVPQAQGEGRAPARRDRGQPAAPHRPAARGAAPAAAARTPGRRGAPPRRPRRRAATRSGSTSPVARSSSCASANASAPTRARDLAQQEQDVRVRLRALDTEVVDAEHALAVPGDDDVADLLARTEALRERSRGLVNLVTERRRGLDRELAAVADEGVVESLVAEAAQLRAQLAAVDADFDALAPTRAEVDAAEARLESLAAGPSSDEAEAAHHGARRDLEQVTERAATGRARARARRPTRSTRATAERAELEPALAEADAAEAEAARVRAEVEADARPSRAS